MKLFSRASRKEQNHKTYIDADGYRRFTSTDDLVHVWQAKKKYPNENFSNKQIHHLDGDKLNNNQENLVLLHKDDHFALHKHLKERKGFILKNWAFILLILLGVFHLFGFMLLLATSWIKYIGPIVGAIKSVIWGFITVFLIFLILIAGIKKV